jgi:hypothetical protein
MKKTVFGIAGALLMLLALVLAGCASAPAAFETAGSLAGTGWRGSQNEAIGTLIVIHDEVSGTFTNAEGQEIPFTYTADYDAGKRSFNGTLTPAGGEEETFSITKGTLFWNITAPGLGLGLNKLDFQYLSPEALRANMETRRRRDERVQQFGALFTRSEAGGEQFQGEGDKSIRFERDGLFSEAVGLSVTDILSVIVWELHSKDGVTIVMLKKNRLQEAYSEIPTGTFKVSKSVSDSRNVITISDGTGDGIQFNGVWTSISINRM